MKIPDSEWIKNADGSVYHLHLLEEHLCPTILTVGDPERVEMVSSRFDEVSHRIHHREYRTHIGRIGKEAVMVMSTGMGTDNIEILFNELQMLTHFHQDSQLRKENPHSLRIIRLGTSGSIRKEIPAGSFVFSEAAFGLDTLGSFYEFETEVSLYSIAKKIQTAYNVSFTPYGTYGSELLRETFRSSIPWKGGITLTLPGFYAPQGRRIGVPTRTPIDIFDKLRAIKTNNLYISNMEMETAAYYSFSNLCGYECISLQAILANREEGTFVGNYERFIQEFIDSALLVLFSRA